MIRFTPAARAPSSRLKVPSRLAVWLVRGILDGSRDGRPSSLMEDEVDAFAGAGGGVGVAQIALDEFETAVQVGEIVAFAGLEIVEAADGGAALDEGLRNPGADEAGTAGDQITRHRFHRSGSGLAGPSNVVLLMHTKGVMETLPPFRLAPYFRTRPWGFNDLAPWYNYKTDGEPIGEVWLTGEMCAADTGPLKGVSLADITKQHRSSACWAPAVTEQDFPLLIKVLFPKEKLSVQVHPDDALAQKYGEPRGKTECWYALDARTRAQVALGIRPGVTVEQVKAAVARRYAGIAAGDGAGARKAT